MNVSFNFVSSSYLSFLYLDVENDPHSKSLRLTDKINTGIVYLPLPEPRLQLVKPQQSSDYKHQITQDFSIRYPYLNNEELNEIFDHIQQTDANRYKINYENLYKNVLQSLLKNLDINEEILQIKTSIKYQNELLPILIHNHKLAKREKKILYNIVTKTWQIFDERIQNEINVQYQLEQIKKEHQDLLNIKIKHEQYQTFYVQLHEIKNDITYLERGFHF
jgi:hypothetical protein